MPKISKVRIVNFTYNDGKRLIADELYDFSSRDREDALNVLINLANGGGKSVLVQLMMQPVIPKAKVAGRRIESFFSKLTDHCYVLLEWLKDNSSEKLLTGISMAARELSSTEDDMGMGVKYYTFYTNYSQDSWPYSIQNLELSRNERGRFLPAGYDDVKKIAKASHQNLFWYSSDDNPKWQKKLAEYGLIQDEWRMMEKLNSEEGGLGKFFGDFKTSDQLIDKLLIPTIESHLSYSSGKEDASLTTMLISYAKQYAAQRDRLEEKSVYEAFRQGLTDILPYADQLWNAEDHLVQATRRLFGLSDALTAESEELQKEENNARSRITELDEQAHHVQWEQASQAYYIRRQAHEEAQQVLAQALQDQAVLQTELEDTEHEILIQESARYYRQLLGYQNEIHEIQEVIRSREQDEESSEAISQLGYSALCAIQEEQQRVNPELALCQENHTGLSEKISAQNILISQKTQALTQAQSACDQVKGKLESAEEETDREVQRLDAGIARMLDWTYDTKEFDQREKSEKSAQTRLSTQLRKLEEEQARAEEQIQQIPMQLADLKVKAQTLSREKTDAESRMDIYHQQEEKIQKICDEYTLDFSQRFTSAIGDYLEREKIQAEGKRGELLRRISLMQEEITAATRGSLHVPSGVINYLNSTNITYQTCENYLLQMVEKGNLTSEECLSILQNYPAAAYGILMDNKSHDAFFSFERIEWLPAMVPIFTYEQMDKILKLEQKFSGAIAFYSENYFADRSHYLARLEEQKQQSERSRALLESGIHHLQQQIGDTAEFTYGENWLSQQQESLSRIEAEIQAAAASRKHLENSRKELTEKKDALKENYRETESELLKSEKVLTTIGQIRLRLEQEKVLADDAYRKRCILETAARTLQEAAQTKSLLQKEMDDLDLRLTQLDQLHQELAKAADVVAGCTSSHRIDGSWQDLLDRYRQRVQSAGTILADLHQRMNEKISLKDQCQTELNRRGLEEETYREVLYSPDLEEKFSRKKKECRSQLNLQNKAVLSATNQEGRTAGSLESAEKALAPFGDPLEESSVGTNFDARLKDISTQKAECRSHIEDCSRQEKQVSREQQRLESLLTDFPKPEHFPPVSLEKNLSVQCTHMIDSQKQCRVQKTEAEKAVHNRLRDLSEIFSRQSIYVHNAITGMIDLLENKPKGDPYYTLIDQLKGHIQNADRAISEITTDLKEFEHFRDDLIYQCITCGRQIHEGLMQMARSSRVTVYEGKPKRQMLRFDFPEQVDAVRAEASIANEIDTGARELVEKLADSSVTDVELRKYAERIIGSRQLFRRYVGMDSIQVEAFKIDQNPENSKYRKWKETQVNNSGAEKFVVYFAVILSLINYTRGDLADIQDKEHRSVLILDNPFGATSSRHILEPMFAIASHFRVQLVCLSDINKSDVIKCFDIVIKAMVRQRPMSSSELLTHEGNEQIEHGFYRAEQMSLI